ncbi:hypothetical protein C8F04DRAFT_78108 [Mycena alexandri]|uniref:MYND-type domain-containing protein n=1 Tax=Mycena alexandri TaxID=1745969 RepID=A0AAD6TB83_9AGAR|nr:hypothetical protein C8F04DRAFT_78108 [Mycena alexandri]
MQVELSITTYGFEGRHVKITMHPVIPPSAMGDGLQPWLVQFIRGLTREVKHSGKWLCSQCGKPARDMQIDMLGWPNAAKFVVYAHQLCENKDGPCDRAAKAESNIWRRSFDFPPNPPNSTRNINPVDQPLSRGCATCQRDPLAAPEVKLKRCGRCKLIRYCSVKCQTDDYPRHKHICKQVDNVEYAKWDIEDRD